ncbi:FKBP-type peptidyl-prolyl cis-trans isomerase [Accumulibacter sp.]|jgi:FKBP-type peptidyl-prolyl cis-trans isomerase SlpA|uniref:FKBP-type peptidyl-prolyl cis-trans isomerase n=1 Tax=Accumulibacter sp. TaxID=2053492 RepID=UPI002C44E7CF|nr:FKBP-type peptidyl-prolyl cis-trans isomerase [Accumulibacter sp.]HPU81366.1 FKBP-type peptidyl-prolyl cis-trans isomerase [Accumulibacter sp.]
MPPPAHATRPANTNATVLPDSFLTLHYSLADRDGDEYVSTFGLSPATLQMGSGQLAETLEQCLLGMAAGKRQVFQLAATDAFGAHNPRLVERIARSALPPEIELRVNSLVEFSSPDGAGNFAGFLRELTDNSALFDFNHPLAGKALRFEVEVIAIL